MSQISWTIVWIIVGLFLNSQCNKNICYEKRIDNYLFYLVFCTYVGSVVILGGLIFANSPLCIHIS